MLLNLAKSRSLVILDAGHGVDTPGKRSPVWKDRTQLFEWEFNRYIVDKISQYLTASRIANIKLITTDKDIPLPERSNLTNTLYHKYKKDYFVYLYSIHGNAYKEEKVNGIEAFTTVGLTVCDTIADITLQELAKLGWNMRYNSKTKLNKDLDYWMLRRTDCPSVITESGFYTNYEECKKMLDPYWRNQIALAHIRAAVKIEFDESITYELV
jgi:N-acetylmuramoyl-L-alanine amidase